MRSTLLFKFIIVYIIFGFLCLFIVETLTSQLTMSRLERRHGQALHTDASLLASEYMPGFFRDDEIDLSRLNIQLDRMSTYLDASIWLVDPGGVLLTSCSHPFSASAPTQIEDFDPAELGHRRYMIGNYHGYFDEHVITAMAPIIRGFATNGFILIHKPYQHLVAEKDALLESVYLTLIIIYLLSFSILLAVQYFIYQPLRQITAAAKQYASGNLDYEIPINTHDEIGHLSASLNYMSNRLKDIENYQKKFIANISHDFRSPLTSIKGYVEAMADGTIPVDNQEKYLKIILFETNRLTDLTQDLLTLGEFDSQNSLLNKSDFDIHEMIKNTAASFEGKCTSRHISIQLLLAAKTLDVHADKSKIQQVLYNLLDNAIKFSFDNSMIIIETTERGGKVSVSVKDYGIGIPKENHNKVWERFYKTDPSRGRDKRGTGLGLAIVKECIQAHGENITLISTSDVGTEFKFSLPKGG